MRKVAFYTLGCRLNFAESSDLMRRFSESGCEVVPFEQAADLYVINTCTVTAAAEKKCRQIIRSAHRLNPEAKIAVVGCFSELRPQEVEQLPGVDFVLGNRNKHRLFEYMQEGSVKTEDQAEAMPFVPSYSTLGRTRSFFKIQDGCNNFCSFCAIPFARGRSRSDTIERTMQTASEIARTGVKEIVLTGVNIGDFGRYQGENFYGLLKQLEQLSGVERIRIGSVEPDLLGDDIIKLVAESRKLMPHFHIPLQAAHDDVLKKMKRHYGRSFYADRVDMIRRLIPHAFIACDVIAGFPTETDTQFQEGLEFLETLDLSALHVFSYSDREEAAASKIPAVYGAGELARRSAALHALSDAKKQAFYARFSGTEAPVLWESDNEGGYMYGYTPNYLRVRRVFDENLVNTIVTTPLRALEKDAGKDWCFA